MTNNTLILITTIILLLFAGCGRADVKYLYKKPVAVVQNVNTRMNVPDMMEVNAEELGINVALQHYQAGIAGLSDLIAYRAVATSVKPPDKENIEHVTTVIVRPINAYGNVSANADISELCIYSTRQSDNLTKTDLITWLNEADGFAPDLNFDMKSITIIPQINITANTQQQFVIEFITERGAKLSDTTTTVIITP